MRGVLTALMAAALGASAIPAAAEEFVPDRIVASIGQQDLAAIARALGHHIVEEGKAGPALIAESAGGVKYFLIGTACETEGIAGCQGILMEARFDLPTTVTADTLIKAHREHPAVNTAADFAAKTLTISRYQVLDHGVSMANIGANVKVFLALIP